MKVYELSNHLYECLGESGAEAVLDAINFYLLENKAFPCEEDKFILASILYVSPYSWGYTKEHNAIYNMRISFGGDSCEHQ